MTAPLDLVIMAAGKGTRMKSRLPKVLQRLAGRPLLGHVLSTAAQLDARSAVVVTGHGADQVEPAMAAACQGGSMALKFVRQEPQLGTGHAVQQAVPALAGDGMVIVLSGDVPLTQADTLRALVDAADGQRLALLTVRLPDPTGYGRIVRGEDGTVQRIVEQKDANDAQRAIQEIYSGIMAVPARHLAGWLARLTNDNAQGEYYLTDVVAMAVADGVPVVAHCIADPVQVAGVNSPLQLAELERAHQGAQARALMEQGVRLADPARFDLRDDPRTGRAARLACGQDVEIDVGCIFSGHVEIGEGARIGAYCSIANATIAAGAVLHPYTHVDGEKAGVSVGEGALVGPFARLRPGAQLGREVHIGNFVEVKNSVLADGAKANHLAYLGDATVGERVNYGAGSITANYDGVNKHRTVIEADVHIGSNCVLVAPVTIGAGGTVGGGSTVTKSTEPGVLTVSRGRQVSITSWKRPVKLPKS
ncbi:MULTISPECIES: bifunctional UDP-N-acetylglucosamine diphosphorylase/glucosamine-1-phosphate N-acetyltransferase GlmU [Delftia]|jgi:bifunctional UDP-N-acetylglucosamine pyrophosphorylase/glucosamine-1-phosphate N-acetyltransferase|uniref:bifunctional UDP-N-acetylglucosamine diphosphorylase/glucosamine-1-phosphate N-acetyltransferase GlmU n=1 Tax=Delftia TaxID=80865 RepID=UPI0005522E64|nr:MULTISPECIES: bifunctional UDP-N-acetylglucosamine diphosphorylase/glucosamine-1-phosphate N-acetyltransferase GlmU [Delftia]PIF35604.1 UDP-N-acetylglucosamine pyrophosphorylase /glucosamine-1-phosphate N-acetyltransferase [Burkholderiales bacterium 23]ATH12204.1 bifunctional N-acetylglucosamine-1-phosphate uridyltransferase/glucosamine-1-phosphate acetyltransferase [Delftia acidovorans]MBD9583975.1 bifunctional UDP-N-acetylglucosamine diphosphorylase/glucosamine-1-phosphate N-acetyltransfera